MKPRNQTVDALKFIAAYGVVVIHLAPSTELAEKITQVFSLFAVPFFLFVSLHFFVRRAVTLPPLREFHFERLLIPYAVWSAVYLVMRWAKYRMTEKPETLDFFGAIFYGDAAVQLYFIPLLLALQFLALALILLRQPGKSRLIALGIILVDFIYLLVGAHYNYLGFYQPVIRAPLYVALVFVFQFSQQYSFGRKVNVIVGILAVAALFTTPFLGFPLSQLGPASGPLVGYGLGALVLNFEARTTSKFLVQILSCSYGIYLAHFAFLEVMEFGLARIGMNLAPYQAHTKLLLAAVICVLSILLVFGARLNRMAAFLLLGESSPVSNRSVTSAPAR